MPAQHDADGTVVSGRGMGWSVDRRATATGVAVLRWFPGDGGFDTWTGGPDQDVVSLEDGAADPWADGLAALGHTVRTDAGRVGHAHAIVRRPDGAPAGAADPRAVDSLAAGW